MKQVDELINELNKFSEDILGAGLPTDHDRLVSEFEKKNGLQLPPDFKYFTAVINGFNLMGNEVYGFNGSNKGMSLEAVYYREHFLVQVPQFPHLVPFSGDGGGNFYCLDTKAPTENGDSCLVVFWESNYHYIESNPPEIVNNSFVDWVYKNVIEFTLEDFDYEGDPK